MGEQFSTAIKHYHALNVGYVTEALLKSKQTKNRREKPTRLIKLALKQKEHGTGEKAADAEVY